MAVIGILAEFNPFHNAHQQLLARARAMADSSGSGHVVVLLSSCFVQRGGPALWDESVRTCAALSSGADAVLSFPYIYSGQTAEVFALGAVQMLSGAGCDKMIFGCEADADTVMEAAGLLANESREFSGEIREGLIKGNSFLASRHEALESRMKERADILKSPNTILALEYYKAGLALKTHMKLVPVPLFEGEGILSAGQIREKILSGSMTHKEAVRYLPENAYPENFLCAGLQQETFCHIGCHNSEEYAHLIKAILIRAPKIIRDMDGYEPGLEFRLQNHLGALENTPDGLENWLSLISSRRHTKSRIRRMLFNALIGCGNEDLALFKSVCPPIVRIAGFRPSGRALLKEMKQKASLGVYASAGEMKKAAAVIGRSGSGRAGEAAGRMIAIEERAWGFFDLFSPTGCSPYYAKRPVQIAQD